MHTYRRRRAGYACKRIITTICDIFTRGCDRKKYYGEGVPKGTSHLVLSSAFVMLCEVALWSFVRGRKNVHSIGLMVFAQ